MEFMILKMTEMRYMLTRSIDRLAGAIILAPEWHLSSMEIHIPLA